MSKKTLTIKSETELGVFETTCEVIRLEIDNPAIHPDSPVHETIVEYWCHEILGIKHNGHSLELINETSWKEAIEQLITDNEEIWNEL